MYQVQDAKCVKTVHGNGVECDNGCQNNVSSFRDAGFRVWHAARPKTAKQKDENFL